MIRENVISAHIRTALAQIQYNALFGLTRASLFESSVTIPWNCGAVSAPAKD